MRAAGETVSAALPAARVGDGVLIAGRLRGEIVAVERARVSISPFGSVAGVAVGDRVEIATGVLTCPVGVATLGRAIDASGLPLDGAGPPSGSVARAGRGDVPAPAQRSAVSQALWTGIRAVDALLTIGRGARIGLFGAPGAGKTTLLETMARGARADAVVLALVGERGREAQRWFARRDRRTSVVCATSDRSAAERVRAADVAVTQARFLCERGMHVVLIVDSLARYAAALREQRVALGESVGRGGYPPSVWAQLARYVEAAGSGPRGSITLFASVLSDGSDEREPLSDAARSLLDGHIVLSSALARAGRFPAIDVLDSTSRTMADVVDPAHARAAGAVRAALAALAQSKDARAVGLAAGGEAALAAAEATEKTIDDFLCQGDTVMSPADTLRCLAELANLVESVS